MHFRTVRYEDGETLWFGTAERSGLSVCGCCERCALVVVEMVCQAAVKWCDGMVSELWQVSRWQRGVFLHVFNIKQGDSG